MGTTSSWGFHASSSLGIAESADCTTTDPARPDQSMPRAQMPRGERVDLSAARALGAAELIDAHWRTRTTAEGPRHHKFK
jgi:hypothetical protein